MIERIISGGQTGVDRAALDAAIVWSISHGGWCPQGRRAEDGAIPSRYSLLETDSPEYQVRTEQNVLDSDATLILFRHQLAGGTKLTRKLARRHDKPYLTQDLAESLDVDPTIRWLEHGDFRVLNVAGPRESTAVGIHEQAYTFLLRLFSELQSSAE